MYTCMARCNMQLTSMMPLVIYLEVTYSSYTYTKKLLKNSVCNKGHILGGGEPGMETAKKE
jgi:hypothetical protein